MVKKDLYYYWTHPDEYPRLKLEDLNSDAAVDLCEVVLQGVRDEMDKTIRMVNRLSEDEGTRHKASALKRTPESPYIEAITFGHSAGLVNELIMRCPEGVFEDDDDRTDEDMEGKQFHNSERNGAPIRDQRVASGLNRARRRDPSGYRQAVR